MGFYVNLPNESKESFLKREGIPVSNSPRIIWESVPKGYLPVVLLDNGASTVAGIAYCENELEEFTRLDDNRNCMIFMVQIAKLLPVAGSDFASYVGRNKLV